MSAYERLVTRRARAKWEGHRVSRLFVVNAIENRAECQQVGSTG
jgi:hypothetical protein